MSEKLVSLRNLIKETFRSSMNEGDGSSERVVKLLRMKHSRLISDVHKELEDIALKRILNDVVSRMTIVKPKSNQTEMFSLGDDGPEVISIRVDGKIVRRPSRKSKLSDVINSLRRTKKDNSASRIKYLEELEELAKSHGYDLTIEQVEEIISKGKT